MIKIVDHSLVFLCVLLLLDESSSSSYCYYYYYCRPYFTDCLRTPVQTILYVEFR